jgi:hypothetical protein
LPKGVVSSHVILAFSPTKPQIQTDLLFDRFGLDCFSNKN